MPQTIALNAIKGCEARKCATKSIFLISDDAVPLDIKVNLNRRVFCFSVTAHRYAKKGLREGQLLVIFFFVEMASHLFVGGRYFELVLEKN